VAILIGTDEAGYGPNLGPLVISATAWQVPDEVQAEGLFGLLKDVVLPSARAAEQDPPRVPIADSKTVYQPGGGLGNLERGVLAALHVLDRLPKSWRQAWQALDPDSAAPRREIPWYADFDAPLPSDAPQPEIESLGRRLASGLAAAGVRLLDVRSRVVFEPEFNRLVAEHGTKGTVLSRATLELAARLTAAFGAGPVSIVCDKHGGRNRYARLIEESFPGRLVEIYGESRDLSVYRFGPAERRIEIRFQARAESCLPVALASMQSKYLRELAMQALNAYWCGRVDGLHPTAGYPHDARRFKTSIAQAQAALGIEDTALWRQR